MDAQTTVALVFGLVLLLFGAELLVRGSSRLASLAGISPLVIGLTVVAYGTSAPELAVTLRSAVSGEGEIAIGNVVGSNIFNVLVILGLSAAITPLVISQQLVRLDVPLMILVSVLLLVFGLDHRIGRLEGAVLFSGVVAYTWFLIRQSRQESEAVRAEYGKEYGRPMKRTILVLCAQIFTILVGLAVLVAGARFLVDGAVVLARVMGVSELVIGLTIVAAGTSLPEVATSIVAAMKGERDIAAGNIIGSNIFNVLMVVGLAASVSTEGIPIPPAALTFDIPVMIAVAVACLPIFFTAHRISRWEGFLFLGYYGAFALYLILRAAEHDRLQQFSAVMMWFVIPLTAVTMALLAIREARQRRSPEGAKS